MDLNMGLSDAGHKTDYGNIEYKILVKCIGTHDIFEASDALEEGNLLAHDISLILNIEVELIIAVYYNCIYI